MKRYAIFFIMILSCAVVSAQNKDLNPTVSVTNDYFGQMVDADREAMEIVVPDSLYSFNLNFDYGGFEKQYKGNSEFNPFYTELIMEEKAESFKHFYLKAGAGYTLHPVFDMAWSINPQDRFKVSAFASHKSYFGKYDKCWLNPSWADEKDFNGYDAASSAGIRGRMDWNKAFLTAFLSYDGIHSEESFYFKQNARGYNSVSSGCRVKSIDSPDSWWKYDVAAKYAFGADGYGWEGDNIGTLTEHVGSYDADVATFIGSSAFDFSSSGKFVSGNYLDDRYFSYSVSVSPKYRFEADNLSVKVGLDLLFMGGDNINLTENTAHDKERFSIWPALELRWNIVPEKLLLYVDASQRSGLFSVRDEALKYHFNMFNGTHSMIKTSNADFGLRGNLFEKFEWKLNAAYERVQNADLPVIAYQGSGVLYPALSLYYGNIEDFNFSFDFKARFGAFGLNGNVSYYAYLHPERMPVRPSALVAGLKASYDFLKTASIYVGADYKSQYRIAGQEDSMLQPYDVPHLINLFAGARWAVTRTFSIFVEGGNLLNRQCQYIPGIAEKGIAVTGGIVLNL